MENFRTFFYVLAAFDFILSNSYFNGDGTMSDSRRDRGLSSSVRELMSHWDRSGVNFRKKGYKKGKAGGVRRKRYNRYDFDYVIADDYDPIAQNESNIIIKIIGPKKTAISNHPSKVIIFKGIDFHCTGTLLTKSHVLTSAHCVTTRLQLGFVIQPTVEYWLRLGSSTFYAGGRIHYVQSFNVHPDYMKEPGVEQYRDLAIVVLKEETKFGHEIAPARVYQGHGLAPGVGEKCYITSWMYRQYLGVLMISTQLRVASLKVLSVDECRGKYNDDYSRIEEHVHICTESKLNTSCLGGSGDGLFCDHKLIAVGSYAFGCAENYPTVFARIDSDNTFMRKMTALNCHSSTLPQAFTITAIIISNNLLSL